MKKSVGRMSDNLSEFKADPQQNETKGDDVTVIANATIDAQTKYSIKQNVSETDRKMEHKDQNSARNVFSEFNSLIETNDDEKMDKNIVDGKLKPILESIEMLTMDDKKFISIIDNNKNKFDDIFKKLLNIVYNSENKYSYINCGSALKSLLNIYKYDEKLIKYSKLSNVKYDCVFFCFIFEYCGFKLLCV